MQIQGGSQSQMYAMSARPTLSKDQLKEQAGQVFSQLDTSNKGYLEQADFAKALGSLNNSDSGDSDELFSQLDADQDGKLTSSEFADSVGEQLYNALGMMPKGRPPMGPPPQEDEGKTVAELSAMVSELEDGDSKMAQGLQNIIDQFAEADTDGDGKVTMQEAMAMQKAEQNAQTPSSQGTEQSSQQKLQHTLMQLMKTYGSLSQSSLSQSSAEQVLSVSA